MTDFDADALLAMLRDPNRETQEIAAAAGTSREDAARASRLVLGIAKAKPEELLVLPGPLALALLRAASTSRRGDLLAALANHPDKAVAKEGKRALYVLRMRGVSVPEVQRPALPPQPAAPEPPVPCYASTVDGHGERALWIARSVTGKGIEVGQAIVSDQRGIVELHVGMLGRKEYRTLGKDLLERGRNMGVGEIDRERAKSIAAAARKLNEPPGKAPPEGTDAWLARLGPAAEPEDPAGRFPPLPEEEERAALEASGRLHDLPLLRGWLASEDALRTLAHKLDEISVSALYLDERQRADAAARTLADAVGAYFTERERALWSSRLFAAAEHLDRAGRPEDARLAAASARALRAGVDASRIPFARLLVEKAFPAPAPPDAGAAGAGASEPPGTLIVPSHG